MVDDFRVEDSGAPFNMAIATLMGIREMFNRIASIQADPLLSRETKQKLIIELTRSIFEQSSCLMKPKTVEQLLPIVDNLFGSNVRQVIKGSPGTLRVTNETKSVYSPELERMSFKLRMDVLKDLKAEGYVMPPKRDLGRAVGDM